MDTGIRSIRDVTTNLRPPLLDDLGLVPALRALAQAFAQHSGLTISFDTSGDVPVVSSEAGLALFRALQEALSNVARHAGATSASVRLVSANGELTLHVQDDGRGFPVAAGHGVPSLGLTGMRERISALNGSVSLDSSEGAHVTVRIPLSRAS